MNNIKLWNSKNTANLHILVQQKKIIVIGISENIYQTKSKMLSESYGGTIYYVESSKSHDDYLDLMESYYKIYHKTPIHNDTLSLKPIETDKYKYVYLFSGNKKKHKTNNNNQIQQKKLIDYDQMYWENGVENKKNSSKTCLI